MHSPSMTANRVLDQSCPNRVIEAVKTADMLTIHLSSGRIPAQVLAFHCGTLRDYMICKLRVKTFLRTAMLVVACAALGQSITRANVNGLRRVFVDNEYVPTRNRPLTSSMPPLQDLRIRSGLQTVAALHPHRRGDWKTTHAGEFGGGFIQYPANWFPYEVASGSRFQVSNIAPGEYWHGGYLPRGAAEMSVTIIDGASTSTLKALSDRTRQQDSQLVVLPNGLQAFELTRPDVIYGGADVGYVVALDDKVYYFSLLAHEVTDVVQLRRTFSGFVASFSVLP